MLAWASTLVRPKSLSRLTAISGSCPQDIPFDWKSRTSTVLTSRRAANLRPPSSTRCISESRRDNRCYRARELFARVGLKKSILPDNFGGSRTGGRVVEGTGLENRHTGEPGIESSNLSLSVVSLPEKKNQSGRVAEWFKAHAWKVCVR